MTGRPGRRWAPAMAFAVLALWPLPPAGGLGSPGIGTRGRLILGMGRPFAEWGARMLPRSVDPDSELGRRLVISLSPDARWADHELCDSATGHQFGWGAMDLAREQWPAGEDGGGETETGGGRRLLQILTVIPQYDLDEAKLLAKNCVIDVVARINRACVVISETIPYYYVDEETRTLMVNTSLVSTEIKRVCWGQGDYVDPFVDIDITPYIQFSVGQGFKGMVTACGISTVQKISCFGSNDPTTDGLAFRSGQAEPPTGKFSQVSVGGLHACGLCMDVDTCSQFGNSMGCWGNNRMSQCSVPPIRQTSVISAIVYSYVSAGYEHTCAFRSDNYLTCWGSNLDGQIQMPNSVLATESKDDGYMSFASAYGCCHDCTVCDCTSNEFGGVGQRCRESAKLSAAWYNTCVIRAGCDVQCAASNTACQAGSQASWYAPGTRCFCAACSRPHEIECFGYNAWRNADAPPGKFKVISVSFDFSCAIYADCNGKDVLDLPVPGTGATQCELSNTLTCWGRNNRGQIQQPAGMCDAAVRARLAAEARINSTVFETPAPPAVRLPCVCTPGKGCDCLSQYPRLEFESGGWVLAPGVLGALLAAALAALASGLWGGGG